MGFCLLKKDFFQFRKNWIFIHSLDLGKSFFFILWKKLDFYLFKKTNFFYLEKIGLL